MTVLKPGPWLLVPLEGPLLFCPATGGGEVEVSGGDDDDAGVTAEGVVVAVEVSDGGVMAGYDYCACPGRRPVLWLQIPVAAVLSHDNRSNTSVAWKDLLLKGTGKQV